MKIEHKFTPMMTERLTAKIERAIRAQSPAVQAVYKARILAGGNAVIFTESTDGLTVLVLIEIGGRLMPLCDATYAELRGAGSPGLN